ncbi:hypothetical protein IWZ00DRAFT_502303 [Phyllosticta capitalensis]
MFLVNLATVPSLLPVPVPCYCFLACDFRHFGKESPERHSLGFVLPHIHVTSKDRQIRERHHETSLALQLTDLNSKWSVF